MGRGESIGDAMSGTVCSCPDCGGAKKVLVESAGHRKIHGRCNLCSGTGSVVVHNERLSERSPLSESADPAMEAFLSKRLTD